MIPGIEKAWDILTGMTPTEVCRRAQVAYDNDREVYTMRSFGIDLDFSAAQRRVESAAPAADVLLKRFAYFSGLSYLWYLVSAQDLPLAQRLVSPANLRGGDIFFRGSHVLPLDQLAAKYATDTDGFAGRCVAWAGERETYGDVSFRLYPLPRVPVTLILWHEDDEFPARADLLYDASCEHQAPLDVLWSVAMMSILILL